MPVKIYTLAYNRPDFIAWQQKTLTKFLKDEHEYIVVNSAPTGQGQLKIAEECQRLGIKCLAMEKHDYVNSSEARSAVMQWLFHQHIKSDSEHLAVILDSDTFMVQELSIEKLMREYDVAAIRQHREHVAYLHTGIMFFKLSGLPDQEAISFWCGEVEGVRVDTGGHLYYWLKNNPQLRIRNLAEHECRADFFPAQLHEPQLEAYQFHIIELAFLHYGRGSNWDQQSPEYHDAKTDFLEKYLKIRCGAAQPKAYSTAAAVRIPSPHRKEAKVIEEVHRFSFDLSI